MAPTPPFRIAHISDLHFSHVSWNPAQFFSKRWVGNCNLIFRRKREFNPQLLLDAFLEKLHSEQIDLVVISGDLSCTSLEKEFLQASSFIEKIKESGVEVVTIPGNHDHYTKKDYQKKTFYQFFESRFSHTDSIYGQFCLKEHQVAVKHLHDAWWLIAMDTTIATPLFSCHGRFSEEIEAQLEKVLALLPEDAYVILANHFPVFTIDHIQRHLQRDDALKRLFQKWNKIKLYLHGHTHRHCMADLRNANLPIILDSGSVAHKHEGSWNLIQCSPAACDVKVFKWQPLSSEGTERNWIPITQSHFKW